MDAFIGEIRYFPYSFTPADWATCSGQLMGAMQNQALFSILGQVFGGTGSGSSATFGIPNLTQRVAIGQGTGPGLTQRNWGQQVGAATVTLNSNQIPAHTHTLNGAFNNGTAPVYTAAPAAGSWFTYLNKATTPQDTSSTFLSAAPSTTLAAASVSSVGNGQAHDNNQPVLCLTPCIALQGAYPIRP